MLDQTIFVKSKARNLGKLRRAAEDLWVGKTSKLDINKIKIGGKIIRR